MRLVNSKARKNTEEENSFTGLFRKYRLLAGFSSISSFVDAMAEDGEILDESLVSKWQRGTRVPSRGMTLKIIKTLIKHGAIKNIITAKKFIKLLDYFPLSKNEVIELSRTMQ